MLMHKRSMYVLNRFCNITLVMRQC